ncbi:MAG: thioredoxin domain-containing protein [Chloroflexi bacterium]|nr:thioredoxin domain-containing protein [Chloroflexota bacterium]
MTKESGMNKRELQREKIRRARQRDKQKVIWVVVAFAVIFVGILIAPNLMPAGAIATPEDPITRAQVKDNGAGDPNAPIKIEEYSDFQCPYCAVFSKQTEPYLLNAYVETGQVYFVYRSFGEFIGPESRAAAEAAYCAGDQGKFWDMHDLLFANQTGENVGNFTNRRVTAFAEKLELDMDVFTTCFNGGAYSSRVDQDGVDGRTAGVQATPSFVLSYVVDGQTRTVLIEGAQPFTEFQAKIETALTEMGLK